MLFVRSGPWDYSNWPISLRELWERPRPLDRPREFMLAERLRLPLRDVPPERLFVPERPREFLLRPRVIKKRGKK